MKQARITRKNFSILFSVFIITSALIFLVIYVKKACYQKVWDTNTNSISLTKDSKGNNSYKMQRDVWKEVLNVDCSDHNEINCNEDFLDTSSGVFTYKFANGVEIVEFETSSGAYQPEFLLFLKTSDKENIIYCKLKLTFDLHDSIEPKDWSYSEGSLYSGVLSVNAENNEFSIFHKSIGHGGCGKLITYSVKDRNVELHQIKANFNCDDPEMPENWTVIYENVR